MSVSLTEVRGGADLDTWVRLPLELYRGDPLYIPQLIAEEFDFFSAAKNPSFAIADTRLVLARKEGRPAGRICGIIHRAEADKLGYRRGRFGWFECVEDPEVARALLGHLEAWFRQESCREMTGPHGFTDLDPEGMLIDGFESLPTIAGSYNKPYYPALVTALGFEKEVDYVETRIEFPQEMPPLFQMMEKKVLPAARSEGTRLVPGLTKRDVMKYAPQFWEVMEASFEPLYGVTPLTKTNRPSTRRNISDSSTRASCNWRWMPPGDSRVSSWGSPPSAAPFSAPGAGCGPSVFSISSAASSASIPSISILPASIPRPTRSASCR
ncbi:MAG: hypothetical protein EHM15_09845 [Desulfobacteraceae bacterium]|nr:MAG: hypothetical protein EHM15_09845 [Desulfobacteraceae bacterium]